ncbi:H-NS histone family protein [Chromobacterium haemolyticum]|uniref:H-NS histone family protein n=1 Tax=Chromobacterium TaxID=535 RepID=UPI0040562A6A
MKFPTAEALGLDLASLSLTQLDGLNQETGEQLKALRKEEEKKDMALIKELAAKHGLQFTLTGADGLQQPIRAKAPSSAGGSSLKGMKHPARYRNPANYAETWTGLGRKPVWVQTYLDNGGKLDDIRIKEGDNNAHAHLKQPIKG